jgi:hypothetical protein
MTYGMHESLEFLDVWRLYPLKLQFSMVNMGPLSALTDLRYLFIGNNPIGGLDMGNIDELITLAELQKEGLALQFVQTCCCSELNTLVAALGDAVWYKESQCTDP